jgi:cation diffusion facilitator family transporter
VTPHPRWALLSLLAAGATIGLKGLAYRQTGSVGILSDALESLVNLAAAAVLLLALWYASSPPDETHAYGHEKIEFFAGGFEGALILYAAWEIVRTAIPRLLQPAPVEQLGTGVIFVLAATAINFATAHVLLREGRRTRSLALETDGRHLLADVYTSLAVVAGLGIVAVTGFQRLDPLIGLGVGLHIMATGLGLLRRSVHGLMDRALEPDELEAIRTAIASQLSGGMTYHNLRTRRVGPRRLADVHLLVPGEMSVRDGHALATAVEQAVEGALEHTEITVHVEPLEGDRGPGHLTADAVRALDGPPPPPAS